VAETRPSSWAELIDALYAGAWDSSIGRFRSSFAFRGMSDAAAPLATALQRLSAGQFELEQHLLRNFRKYARRSAVADDSPWNWMVLAQHHGLPTRLLDWSYSPFVALHFATARRDCLETDGVVWCLNYVEMNRALPPGLRSALDEEGSNVLTVEMLDARVPTLQALAEFASKPFAFFFEPPSLNERIVNQYALLSSTSDPALRLDDWLRERESLARRVIVPARLKLEVRDKLDQANINERVLFPGLDGLSRWLTRLYTPNLAGQRDDGSGLPGGSLDDRTASQHVAGPHQRRPASAAAKPSSRRKKATPSRALTR
jgi:hypothetical protein